MVLDFDEAALSVTILKVTPKEEEIMGLPIINLLLLIIINLLLLLFLKHAMLASLLASLLGVLRCIEAEAEVEMKKEKL